MSKLKILKISEISVYISFHINIFEVIFLIIKAVRIIRINVIRCKHTRTEVTAFYIFSVHGRLVLVFVRLIGMRKRICGNPVAESERNLKAVIFGFVLYHSIACSAQKCLKWRCGLGIKILTVIIFFIRMLVVGINYKVWLPFNSDNPAYKPLGYICRIRSVRFACGLSNFSISMYNIY